MAQQLVAVLRQHKWKALGAYIATTGATFVALQSRGQKSDGGGGGGHVGAVRGDGGAGGHRCGDGCAFDGLAKSYDKATGMDEVVMGLPLMRRALCRHARGSVLEVSCGTGRNLSYLVHSDDVTDVTCTDVSAPMVDVASTKATTSGLTGHKPLVFRRMDATELAFRDAQFDTVIDSFGLCSCDDPVAALREMARVVRQPRRRTPHNETSAAQRRARGPADADDAGSQAPENVQAHTRKEANHGRGAGVQRNGAVGGAGAQRNGAVGGAGAQRNGAVGGAGAQRNGMVGGAGVQRNGMIGGAGSDALPASSRHGSDGDVDKGGRILLLEHGRSHYNWLSRLLDANAPQHAEKWGCWFNRDIRALVDEAGLRVDIHRTFHFGTTHYIVARPPPPPPPPSPSSSPA